MAKWGNVDFLQLLELQERINQMYDFDQDEFCRDCANELAQRLYRKVVKRTPVGDYDDTYELEDDGENKFLVMSDRKGGTLRKSWTVKSVVKQGNNYVCEIINPVEYASYVEYGHRQLPGRYVPAINKKLTSAWTEGKFMLTISEKEIQSIAPKLIEKRLQQKLEEMLNGK